MRQATIHMEGHEVSTLLPVNATSPEAARKVAEHAAQTQVPKGLAMTVDALVKVEHPARPFSRVALEESGVRRSDLKTYVFGVTITGEVTK